MLQGSLQHRVAHLPCVARWELVTEAVRSTARRMADAALALAQCTPTAGSQEDLSARAQLELPMRHGGMGLHRLSPAQGMAAFLASAVPVHVAMVRTPPQFRPFDGPAGPRMREEWGALQRHLGRADSQGVAVDDVCIRSALPMAQKDTSKAAAASRLRSLTSLHDDEGGPLRRAQQHKARLLSCASRASSIWLTALPIHNAFTLCNSAFCNAFKFRLGIAPRPMQAPRVRCGCGALVDPPPRI